MTLDHLAIIERESERFAELLDVGPLDAPISGCPGWNLGDLGLHLVGVQRWANGIVRSGVASESTDPLPEPTGAAEALRASSNELVQTLSKVDPDSPCWNFTSGPQTMAFWFMRQANEIAVHRWDAEAATSDSPQSIETELAAHVADEFIHSSMQRIIERQAIDVSQLPGDVHLHCTDLAGLDAPGEWTIEIIDGALTVTDEHRKCAVAVRGKACDLALFLYNRIDQSQLEVFGEPDVLREWSSIFTF